jgi:hypothetical protein
MPAVPAGCNYTNKTVSSAESLSPGTYCGGLTVSGSTGRATLAAGNYFMVGGGLEVKSAGTLTGTGVTIINTSRPGYSFQGFNVQSSGVLNVTAPSTGSLAGVVFFEDPATASANGTNTISSGGGSTIVGSFYFPVHHTVFSSAAATTITGGLVAKSVEIKNNNTVVRFTGFTSGASYPFKKASLVE